MTVEAQAPTRSLREVQDSAYARLHLSEYASLSQVVGAIKRREDSRQFFHDTTPADAREADALYEASLSRALQNELAYCLELAKRSPIEGLQTLTSHLEYVQNIPLSDASLKNLDETFFGIALETLVDDTSTAIEKAAGVMLSLQFGAEQRGVAKTQMILEERLSAEQTTQLHHINPASQHAAATRLEAIQSFFDFAGLEYESQIIDSTMSVGVRRAAERAKTTIDKSKQALGDSAKVGRKAVGITVLASMGIVGGASVAAAETPSPQTPSLTSAEAAVVAQSIQENKEILEVPVIAAVVETVSDSAQAASVEVASTKVVDAEATVVEVDVATIPVGAISSEATIYPTAIVEVSPDVQSAPDITKEQEAQLAPAITPNTKSATSPAVVEVVPSVETNKAAEATQESTTPATVVTPNSDVNVAVGETPQEALARIVASRDMNAASYAIRKLYSGTPDKAPVNETLTAAITADVASLRTLISDAAHAEATYTEKSYLALAYLDAVSRSPSLLDNPEVAAFVASLSDQGDEYRNKLFAQYLAEAKVALSAEAAGSYTNIAEPYRGPLEVLYAYTAMAGVSDQKQVEQIEAIKAEEARIAEEARKAAEEAERQRLEAGSGVELPGAPTEASIMVAAAQKIADMGGEWTNRGLVMKYFLEKGFTPEQAAGIIGNFMVESGVDPSKKQYGGGPGRGLAQWGSTNPKYDRFGYDGSRGLTRFAKEQGKPWEDLYVQLDYIMHELTTSEKRAYQALTAATSVEDAANIFEDKYERAGIPHMERRLESARALYEAYQGAVDATRQELTAAYEAQKQAAQAEIDRRAAEEAERQRQAEASARAAAEQGDIRSQLADGAALREQLKAKYENVSGQLDASELTSLPGFSKYGESITIRLHPEAAKGYEALAAAFKAHFGEDLRLTDHYRDLAAQHRTKETKGALAATPGKSLHGWGMALDIASDVNKEGSPQHEWMEQNAHKYGWVNPNWAHDGKGIEEPWHWEFNGNKATFEETN